MGKVDGRPGQSCSCRVCSRRCATRTSSGVFRRPCSPGWTLRSSRAEAVLADAGVPTLVHGDVWEGNLIVRREAERWRLVGLLDPGSEYADVESELAYLEVFDHRRDALFAAYTARRPLRSGYERRRLFYWLHTALVHVALFGDPFFREYAARVAAAIREQATG